MQKIHNNNTQDAIIFCMYVQDTEEINSVSCICRETRVVG